MRVNTQGNSNLGKKKKKSEIPSKKTHGGGESRVSNKGGTLVRSDATHGVRQKKRERSVPNSEELIAICPREGQKDPRCLTSVYATRKETTTNRALYKRKKDRILKKRRQRVTARKQMGGRVNDSTGT